MRETRLSWAGLALSLLACGGAAPEPETPAATPEPAASSAPQQKETEEDSSKEKESTEAKSEAAGTSEGAVADSAPAQDPKDVLLKPDVLYVFSFTASEPHQVAEKQCTKTAKDDPKKMSECMSKASKKVERDAMSFSTDADGKYFWLTVKRKGGALVTLHRIGFEVSKESGNKLTLELHGPDKGKTPMGSIPKQLVVQIEGESALAIDDPKLGHLVYEAKLGLMGNK